MIKEIGQNSDRYKKVGGSWVVSASKDIKPIELPIGVPLSNLKPVIKVNGIIVKVGNDHLCSLTTLNDIKNSNNPHYDIVGNGMIMVKDKSVVIGKTIKIIELDITKLQGLIDSREFMNRQSGVTSIQYTNDANDLVDGIPKKLIDQINYTLDRDSNRPSDKFEVVDYFKMVDKEFSPYYTIKPIREVTDQQETVFDPLKLQTFIIELSDQLSLLRRDFNTIQKTFFEGIIPTPNTYGLIQEDIIARTDVDDLESNHSVKTNESSSILSIEDSPVLQVKSELDRTNNKITDTQQQLEEKINSGQSTNQENQNYLSRTITELQQQIKNIKVK